MQRPVMKILRRPNHYTMSMARDKEGPSTYGHYEPQGTCAHKCQSGNPKSQLERCFTGDPSLLEEVCGLIGEAGPSQDLGAPSQRDNLGTPPVYTFEAIDKRRSDIIVDFKLVRSDHHSDRVGGIDLDVFPSQSLD